MFSRAVRRLWLCRRATTSGRPASWVPRWRARTSCRSGRTASRSAVPSSSSTGTVAPVASTTASGSPTATSAPTSTTTERTTPPTGDRDHVLHLHGLEDEQGRTLPHGRPVGHRDLHHRALDRGVDGQPGPGGWLGLAPGPDRRRRHAAGMGKMLVSADAARTISSRSARLIGAWPSAAVSAVVRTLVSPGVQKASTPGVDSTKSTARATSSHGDVRLVPRPRGAVPPAPRPGRHRLDGHHPDVVLAGVRQQRLRVPAVGGVRPQLGIDREHHGVEVVAAQGLEVGRGRGQLVSGDAHPPAQPLVPGGQDGLHRPAPGLELPEVGHRMHLVEVEPVAAKQGEGLLQLGSDPVGAVSQGLAGHEEPVPDGRDARAQQLLGPPVLGGDVEVVDPGVHRGREGRPRPRPGSPSQKAAPPRTATDERWPVRPSRRCSTCAP